MFKKIIIMLFLITGCAPAYASSQFQVDMLTIAKMESSLNMKAYNESSGARGLFQITPICLKDYNQFHPKAHFSQDDLFQAWVSHEIADWYMNERIPHLLHYLHHPDTLSNRLISYNCGVGCVGRKLPLETQNYLKRYNALSKE